MRILQTSAINSRERCVRTLVERGLRALWPGLFCSTCPAKPPRLPALQRVHGAEESCYLNARYVTDSLQAPSYLQGQGRLKCYQSQWSVSVDQRESGGDSCLVRMRKMSIERVKNMSTMSLSHPARSLNASFPRILIRKC